MTVFKCKMCGGTLEINNNETVATCEYCGTKQTLPKIGDERKANLYDRANHFRRNNEFDKAMGIYEQILNEDNTDAEAYWSLVLCRYGIEYVEDPATHKRVPTVNRAQFTSVFDDDNYRSALQYADEYQKSIYEEEAKAINEIQKGILAISQKEDPFDIFICYKETDNNGRRTPDSVLANDLYHQLTQEGFKVFFARITLEDKLGSAYEPYIFAALNSATAMVVLGTKPEYFNAVWVKNEWSRYLALIKQGEQKILIPAYRDMDPYDLPEEFSHLQAQDMSKLGFMQDLIRGIKKIVDTQKAEPIKETVVSVTNSNVAPLLKRALIFLEDGDWESANEYCEKVLDSEPENAEAYLGKLMAELKVKRQADLKDCEQPFDTSGNYVKALRFGDEKLKKDLTGYIDYINTRNENNRLDGIYNEAKNIMDKACTEIEYKEAKELFESISGYLDSDTLAQECIEKAEIALKDKFLQRGTEVMEEGDLFGYRKALGYFQSIPGWKNADELATECKQKIEELEAKAEEERLERERQREINRKKEKKATIITTPIICALLVFIIVLNTVIIPSIKYNEAIAQMENGNYVEAYESFMALDDYKDSADKAKSIYGKYFYEKLKVGDYIAFGSYEQDNNTSNGKEDIEWLILEKQDNKVLVISKYALDCKPYNTSKEAVTWENCTLRKWLNNEFFNSAFSTDEKAMIPTVTVVGDYDTDFGNATVDKVFILSISEAKKFFSSDESRKCKPTDYTTAKGVYKNRNYCYWWLRSSGFNQSLEAVVDNIGGVNKDGNSVNNKKNGVRPAMWIDLSSIEYK